MTAYASQLLRARVVVISTNKQTNYGTALADAALIHNLRHDGKSFAQAPLKQYYDDSALAKGWPQPTFRIEIERQTKLSLSGLPCYDFLAGWLGAFCFGKDTITGSGPYTHKFTQDLSTSIAPVTTVYIEDTADVKFKLQDMAITTLKFTGGAIGPVLADVSMIGSGMETDGAMADGPPALTVPSFILNNDADILLGPPGEPVSIKNRIRSWSVSITMPMEDLRAPGSGKYAAFTRRGDLSLAVSLGIAAKDTDDVRTLFVNDTDQELQINVNSGASAQLKFRFPNIQFKGVGAADGQFVVWNLDADETSIFKPDSATEPIEMTAINGVATYLVAA